MSSRKVCYIATLIAIVILGNGSAYASSSARIQVTATVLPYINFQAVQHVVTYHVGSQELEKGYIDLPNAISVSVRTNVSGGVPVFVDSQGGGRILLRESGSGSFQESTFTMNTAGYRPNTPISKNYDSRIVLPADAREGVYTLNIAMTPAI